MMQEQSDVSKVAETASLFHAPDTQLHRSLWPRGIRSLVVLFCV
jgi:hypothetical protein